MRFLVSLLLVLLSVGTASAYAIRANADGYTIVLNANEQLILLRFYGGLSPAVDHVGAVMGNFLDNAAHKIRASDQQTLCSRWKTLTASHQAAVSAALGLPENPCPDKTEDRAPLGGR